MPPGIRRSGRDTGRQPDPFALEVLKSDRVEKQALRGLHLHVSKIERGLRAKPLDPYLNLPTADPVSMTCVTIPPTQLP